MKVRENENDVTIFSLITCLSLMWKIFNGIITDELHDHLQSDTLLAEVQKGCPRKSRGTNNQLLTDKKILRNYKRRITGLGIAWIAAKRRLLQITNVVLLLR